jgi:hypothetical protein
MMKLPGLNSSIQPDQVIGQTYPTFLLGFQIGPLIYLLSLFLVPIVASNCYLSAMVDSLLKDAVSLATSALVDEERKPPRKIP